MAEFDRMLAPSELNEVLRLVFVAKRCGSQFFDNADSFDQMFGRGRFAEYDGRILDTARGVVEALADRGLKRGIDPANPVEDLGQNIL